MNHKMSTMLMKHLYITSVYLTGLMHLSMRGCVYSQSGRIPIGHITAGQMNFVFFFFFFFLFYLGQRIKAMEL